MSQSTSLQSGKNSLGWAPGQLTSTMQVSAAAPRVTPLACALPDASHSVPPRRPPVSCRYVMDNRVGNTNGLGAAFGILSAIGVKVPTPGSLGWNIALAVNRVRQMFSKQD